MKRQIPSEQEQPKNTRKGSWDFRTMAHFEQRLPAVDDQSSSTDVAQSGRGKDGNETAPSSFEQISHHVHKIEKFSISRHVTEFTLNANVKEPDEALKEAFDKLVDLAIKNAEEGGRKKVAKLGVWLMGKGLNDPIVLPVRPLEQNNSDVLMAELDKLGQSDGDDEHGGSMDKRTLFLSDQVQVVITCLTPPTGAGARFYPHQYWGYNERQRIKIKNIDNDLCMFYALISGKTFCQLSAESAFEHQQQKGKRKNRNRARSLERFLNDQPQLSQLVMKLIRDADLPANLNGYGIEHLERVQSLWDRTEPGMFRIILFEHAPEVLPRPLWKGPSGKKHDVVLFLKDGHYDAIKQISTFFRLGRKYCIDCECTYSRDTKHTMKCKSRCPQCANVGPQYPCVRENGVKILCVECNRFFFSQICFDAHRAQTCQLIKRCDKICQRVYQYNKNEPHVCYSSYCRRCKVFHTEKSTCFIQKVKVPKKQPKYRIVCYDTETLLEQLEEEGQTQHKVNYLSARITCNQCCDTDLGGQSDECEICMTIEGRVERTMDWSEANREEPVVDFVEWILRAWSEHFDTYIWAHNASRFDGHFVLKYLAESRRRPEVVMNGLKIYQFIVQHSRKTSKLIWRDSYLLMPIPLDQLKKTFNLACEDKPFFPYLYNKRENYTVRLPNLPPKSDYATGSMKRYKFEKFEKWYEENKQKTFYLPDELRDYCRNDTEILLNALIQFRQILIRDITQGFDVLPISCTIASGCMNIFRAQFMQKNQLALVPEGGYERNDRASIIAIKYLDWRAKNDNCTIEHAGNGREKCWKQYKLDGWVAAQNKCIEVLGCYWHGCERCFNAEDELADGKTCRELLEATQDRLMQLKEPDEEGNCIEVEEIWECEIKEQLEHDERMRAFFSDLGNERGPIDPRQAYYGGRTGPLRLYAEPAEDEKISVFDIVSLYPWVNYSTEYPVDVPEIVQPHNYQDEICVDWTQPSDIPYKGILRVRIIPPRTLRVPVLPLKLDERLLFSLCHRCAANFRKQNTRCEHRCVHTDRQRAYTGNYTHIELERALELGYKVDRLWRAWSYKKWSASIFKGYVRLLIKLKVIHIEASGFPDGVTTEEQKQMFSEEYMRAYSVLIEIDRVQKNPGLRFIAKLMLNSLWGKFSMRNALSSNIVVTRPQEFFKLIFDNKTEISAIVPMSDDAIRVLYRKKKNFVSEHSSSNIVLSLWTTSRARLKLYDYMRKIEQTDGAKLLYTDTDSVVVLHKRNRVPIKTGEFLGQMCEEYSDYEIKEFVCGGAKQYGFRMLNKNTGEEEIVQKIRGITFDVENSKAMQFAHFKQKVLSYGHNGGEEPINFVPSLFRYQKIQPTKDSRIITRAQTKKYLPVCQKGIIDQKLEVFPFGFV